MPDLTDGESIEMKGSAAKPYVLKNVKTFHDAEALVVDHQPGKGKHRGKLGALIVHLEDGTKFSVGTGFSDAQRASPPPIGSYITFRYQELSDAGVPRFPSFVRTRKPAAREPEKEPAARKRTKAETRKKTCKSTEAASRYFELIDGESNKFWEIAADETEVTVRYGRIGSKGTTKAKTFDDANAANEHVRKLIDEKTAKGYVEH